jgi:hypothetical protein
MKISLINSDMLYSNRWRSLSIALRVGALLAILLTFTACPKNPSITVNITPNEVGGTMHVSGSGFTGGGHVSVSAANTPGHPAIETVGSTTADSSGSISVDFPFSWPGPGILPGCAQGSTSTVTVTITATDNASNSPTFATIAMVNCGTLWSQSPA